MIEGWKPGKEMLTVLKSMNQCRYIDWSVVVDPVKSGDDAVTKENSCSVVITTGRLWVESWETWKNPRFPNFYLMEQ